eukprot:TRINITY_DN6467_c0_g1_i2.p3 TRINITY_DN6467_c0_g1~~TRINITY_DN6467_c0_g1_i2.p3  ORF type:complete len:147 (-),score=8.26 TRINITY_DN6467_c0_g1_i2:275-715(-)
MHYKFCNTKNIANQNPQQFGTYVFQFFAKIYIFCIACIHVLILGVRGQGQYHRITPTPTATPKPTFCTQADAGGNVSFRLKVSFCLIRPQSSVISSKGSFRLKKVSSANEMIRQNKETFMKSTNRFGKVVKCLKRLKNDSETLKNL